MWVAPLLIVTFSRLVQLAKAPSVISLTVPGIVISFRLVQPEKLLYHGLQTATAVECIHLDTLGTGQDHYLRQVFTIFKS